MAASVLALLLLLARWAPRVPGPLITVLAATALVVALSLDANGIDVIGQIPTGPPSPGVPGVSVHQMVALIIPAGGIAIVAFSDNVLTGRIFASRKGQEIDANAELRAVGTCNVAAGSDARVSGQLQRQPAPRLATRSVAAPSRTRLWRWYACSL